MKKLLLAAVILFCNSIVFAQDTSDVEVVRRMVNLSEVVVRSDLNVSRFLQRVKNDTTFYKAFKNLRVLGFTSLNDIRMLDKKGRLEASLQSKTRQTRQKGCRTMEVIEEITTGDMYDRQHQFNYYTAELYGSLFFTQGSVCGETNIVGDPTLTVRSKSGVNKHKEQLKMLFFNPGKRIPGIPFMGNKLDIFDEDVARNYQFSIDTSAYNGQSCYVFTIKSKPDLSPSDKNDIVFDNITTWFHSRTMEIVARNYDLSYNAGVYDFNVHMEVQMTRFGQYLVPQTIRYKGNWDVPFKKRERGIFTATLFDFKSEG